MSERPASTTAFTHDQPGTPESQWRAHFAAEPVAAYALPKSGHLVVLAAHPDDETLGAGGFIATAAALGWQIDVVVATDGEASHPESPTHTPARLAEIRRSEVRAAVDRLAPSADLRFVGLPDAHLADGAARIVDEVVALIGMHGTRTTLLAPWRNDAHCDHDALGSAASIVASRTDAQLLEYPIWLWHWGTPANLSSKTLTRLELTTAAQDAKAAALAQHRSQHSPLSEQPGDAALLQPEFLEHFRRDYEIFVCDRQPAPDTALDELHTELDDPWQVDTSQYERDKRARTVAALPRAHYASVLEIGCSIGALTAELATRADQVLGLDASPAALRRAQERLSHTQNVRLSRAQVPHDFPDAKFELVVVSEVGYFLSPQSLDVLADRIHQSLVADGQVLLCHWRHDPVGWVMNGDVVHHRAIARLLELDERRTVLHHFETDDYVLDVVG